MVMASWCQRCHFIIFWPPCFQWKLTCHSYHCSPACNMALFHWFLSRVSLSWGRFRCTWVWLPFILLEFNEEADWLYFWYMTADISSPTVPSCLRSERAISQARCSLLWCWREFQTRPACHTHECHRRPMAPTALSIHFETSLGACPAFIPFHALGVHVWLHPSYIKNPIWGGTRPTYSSHWGSRTIVSGTALSPCTYEITESSKTPWIRYCNPHLIKEGKEAQS